MKRVGPGKIERARASAFHHRTTEQFGDLHQTFNGFRRAPRIFGDDDRASRAREHVRQFVNPL